MEKLFVLAAVAALALAGTAQTASWVLLVTALSSLGAALHANRPRPARAVA